MAIDANDDARLLATVLCCVLLMMPVVASCSLSERGLGAHRDDGRDMLHYTSVEAVGQSEG